MMPVVRGAITRRQFMQAGVTLVELLVSIGITAVVMAGVIEVMVDNKTKFIFGEQVAVIQENARFATEEIAREIRVAGSVGDCSIASSNVANTVNFPIGVGVGVNGDAAIEGWDSAEAVAAFPADFAAANRLIGTDAFVIRRADSDDVFNVTGHPLGATEITVTAGLNLTHGISAGAIMAVASQYCRQVSIFQHVGAGALTFDHQGGAGLPNCTGIIGSAFDCNSVADATVYSFANGSSVMQFLSISYYIAPSSIDPGIPALYKGSQTPGNVSVATELLVGVENMQVLYGIDTDPFPNADGQANQYVTANNVADWGAVVSVRLSLLFRSLNNVLSQDQTFTFEGVDYTDRLLRQRITLTVQLRNIGL